ARGNWSWNVKDVGARPPTPNVGSSPIGSATTGAAAVTVTKWPLSRTLLLTAPTPKLSVDCPAANVTVTGTAIWLGLTLERLTVRGATRSPLRVSVAVAALAPAVSGTVPGTIDSENVGTEGICRVSVAGCRVASSRLEIEIHCPLSAEFSSRTLANPP